MSVIVDLEVDTDPHPARVEGIEGSEDWVKVVGLYESESYDWSELRVFWSPSAGRYFWLADSGCSCSYWADGATLGAFENGDRAAAMSALKEWLPGNWQAIMNHPGHHAVEALRTFKETRA